MVNLEKNVKIVQTGSFVFLVVLMTEFIVQFCLQLHETTPSPDKVPAFGDNYAQVVSIFIFTWAYPMFVPSWANEKKDHVSINRTIWVSGIASWVGYVGIGLLCALANPVKVDDMLVRLSMSPNVITAVCSYLFAIGVIAPGIPVASITVRYNLFVGKVCGKRQSFFWGVIFPWLISWIFAQGEVFANLLLWSSLIFNGLVNFVLPLVLYYTAMRTRPEMWNSIIQPLPRRLRRFARLITVFLIVATSLVIAIQILADFYFLIFMHENVLAQ